MLKIVAVDLSIRSIKKKKEIKILEKIVVSILVLSHCQPSSTVIGTRLMTIYNTHNNNNSASTFKDQFIPRYLDI